MTEVTFFTPLYIIKINDLWLYDKDEIFLAKNKELVKYILYIFYVKYIDEKWLYEEKEFILLYDTTHHLYRIKKIFQ